MTTHDAAAEDPEVAAATWGADVEQAEPDGGAVDRLFEALSRGDVEAARACCTPDARIWHGFDQVALDLDGGCRGWAQFVAGFPERAFVDVRRYPTAFGLVQQHLMVARHPSGARLGWPICIVVHLRDGLISRLEEYIDRAGTFPVADGDTATPGLQLR